MDRQTKLAEVLMLLASADNQKLDEVLKWLDKEAAKVEAA